MNKREIENKIVDLKADYTRIQADLEKVVAVGSDPLPGEKVLENMEAELKELYKQLESME